MAAGAPALAASACGLRDLRGAVLKALPQPAMGTATLARNRRGNCIPVLEQTEAESETGLHGACCCESRCSFDL